VEHELKTWPKYFDLLWTGRKTFEIRRDERGRGKIVGLLVDDLGEVSREQP
jgi:hypothetical protein